MSKLTNIKDDLAVAKDFKIFTESFGGKVFLEKTIEDIATGVMQLELINTKDEAFTINTIVGLKKNLEIYNSFVNATSDIDLIQEALKEYYDNHKDKKPEADDV
jgi:hypothetical protein